MRKLHPFTAVRDAVAYGVQFGSFGFFAVIFARSVDAVPLSFGFALAPVFALVGVGYALARYAVFRYELGETALHITSGVVRRQQREIPLGRIQNVDVQQSLLPRLLGLAVVRFETAGGGSTEATLRLVSKPEADRLRRKLRDLKRETTDADDEETGAARRTGDEETATATEPSGGQSGAESGTGATAGAADPAPAAPAGAEPEFDARPEQREPTAERGFPEEEETLLFELSLRELLVLSGLTVRWSVVPFILFALPMLGDLLLGVVRRALGDALTGTGPDPALIALAVGGFAALLLVAWVVGAAVTFAQYYGFRLARVGDELVYERGLLQRYSGSIPLDKVQTLTVTENLLMRRFGFAALAVETAGYAAGGGQQGDSKVPSAVPLADREAVRGFVERFEGVDDLSVERPPKRARRRYAGRYALVALGLGALLLVVDRTLVPLGWLPALPLVGLLLAPPAAHLKWRHLGHRSGEEHFLGRAGFWRRSTRVVPYYRVQTVLTERTVFQRRWAIGSVVADTAASGSLLARDATAHDVDDDVADALHDHLRERLRTAVAARRAE